jgi:probable rRNA maturation factor
MEIEVNNQQQSLPIDAPQLIAAVRGVLAEAGVVQGEISIAVVNDEAMQRLNAQYLDHDWPTDVLSFVIEAEGDRLEGQLIVSAETATRTAPQYDWSAADELLLYVIHGALHLVGYDDHSDEDCQRMREAEQRHLAQVERTSSSVRASFPPPCHGGARGGFESRTDEDVRSTYHAGGELP